MNGVWAVVSAALEVCMGGCVQARACVQASARAYRSHARVCGYCGGWTEAWGLQVGVCARWGCAGACA